MGFEASSCVQKENTRSPHARGILPEMKEKADVMSEQPTINIADLSKADVLAALFNAAEAPRRMGALQFDNGPYVMPKEWAAKLVDLGSAATPDYDGISIRAGLRSTSTIRTAVALRSTSRMTIRSIRGDLIVITAATVRRRRLSTSFVKPER